MIEELGCEELTCGELWRGMVSDSFGTLKNWPCPEELCCNRESSGVQCPPPLGELGQGLESLGRVWFRTVLRPCRMVPASRNSAAIESLPALSAHPLWETLGRVWNSCLSISYVGEGVGSRWMRWMGGGREGRRRRRRRVLY